MQRRHSKLLEVYISVRSLFFSKIGIESRGRKRLLTWRGVGFQLFWNILIQFLRTEVTHPVWPVLQLILHVPHAPSESSASPATLKWVHHCIYDSNQYRL